MFLYGASQHAKVVIEVLELLNVEIEGLFDDDRSIREIFSYKVQRYVADVFSSKDLIITIGDNHVRKKIASIVSNPFFTAVHPNANVSGRCVIGWGSVVIGGATINTGTIIGRHCIINTNSSVDHDCNIQDFVHISPNASLCGSVEVGEGTHIGAGSTIIPGRKIGSWSIIGAGSVVIGDIPSNCLAFGNPCKVVKSLN